MAWAEQLIIDEFHKLYYEGVEAGGRLFEKTTWFGVACLKCPLDLWIYQEILFRLKPDLIIETGSFHGGSALYLAHLCDLLGHGHIATIDIWDRPRPAHPRITYITGSSADPANARAARACAPETAKVLVILDADHSEAHVLEELRLFAPLVSAGSYMIVEDTNVNGHPACPSHGPGPYEAVTRFLAECADFSPDPASEKFLMTFNPRGYLRKHAPGEPRNAVAVTPAQSHSPELDAAVQHLRQREIEQLAAQVQANLRSADGLRQELAQRSAELTGARVELAQRSGEVAQRNDELARLTGELSATRAELEQVKARMERICSHWLVRPALWLRSRIAALLKGR